MKILMDEQFKTLSLIKDKLSKHFGIDDNLHDHLWLTKDKEETMWMLSYDWYACFSFDTDKEGETWLGVSFDMETEPDHSAQIMYCLLRNNIDIQVCDSYFIDRKNGDMYWGEEAEEKYEDREIQIYDMHELLKEIAENIEDLKNRNYH